MQYRSLISISSSGFVEIVTWCNSSLEFYELIQLRPNWDKWSVAFALHIQSSVSLSSRHFLHNAHNWHLEFSSQMTCRIDKPTADTFDVTMAIQNMYESSLNLRYILTSFLLDCHLCIFRLSSNCTTISPQTNNMHRSTVLDHHESSLILLK